MPAWFRTVRLFDKYVDGNESKLFENSVQLDLGLICTPNLCSNGGTCVVNGSSVQCICPVNFAGARCEWSKKEAKGSF